MGHEFSEVNNLVVPCNRLFIPVSLREKVLQIIHRSHLGIVKAKSLLCRKVYWYGIDKEIENFLSSCASCQKLLRSMKPTPVKMTELPSGPWKIVAADFYGQYEINRSY